MVFLELKQIGSLLNSYLIYRSRIDSAEINLHNYSQSMTKEARIYNGGKIVSSISGVGITGQLYVKE